MPSSRMGSETQAKVPVVDLSSEDLKPGTEAWLLACKQVKYALEDYGCFEVVYHKVPLELHNSIFSVLEDLFDLPLETKMQKTSDKPTFFFIPLYESLAVDNPTTLEGAQDFTRVMWPAGNDSFCESAHSYSKLVAELDQMVTRMVFDIYGVERLYDSHMASTTYLLRCTKYRTQKMNETNLGAAAHTDKNFASILHENQVHGLQIKTEDGQWIDVDLSPSTFLFMAGDPFMAWSNDRVRSCEHQVIMKENKTRYSLAFFSWQSGILQVPEELVDDNHPLMHKPFDHLDFVRLQESGATKKCGNAIKAYCGL